MCVMPAQLSSEPASLPMNTSSHTKFGWDRPEHNPIDESGILYVHTYIQ